MPVTIPIGTGDCVLDGTRPISVAIIFDNSDT